MRDAVNNAKVALLAAVVAVLAGMTVWVGSALASEGDLAAGVAAQSAEGNTTMHYAQELKSGRGVIGTFDSKDDTNSNLYEYWYKIKASNRWSVYSVKLESIDGRALWLDGFNEDGSAAWYGPSSGITAAWTYYKSDVPRGSYYYFKVWPNKAIRYDQFKITATEHPIIKRVTSVSTSKKAASSLKMRWNAQANATKYQVRWKTKGQGWKYGTATKNSMALKGLKRGSKYTVQVRAYHAKGYNLDSNKVANWGLWSTARSFKTK